MFARRSAINNAIHKFEFAHTQDLRSFAMIFHDELRTARNKMISEYKFPPEQDIHRTHIDDIQSEYNKLEQNFIKQYAKQTLNTQR